VVALRNLEGVFSRAELETIEQYYTLLEQRVICMNGRIVGEAVAAEMEEEIGPEGLVEDPKYER
jgi:hypothetical protein